MAKGDTVSALADLDNAIKLNPQYPDALDTRGNLYATKGQYDSAIADFSAVVAADPRNANAHANLGNAYRAKGQSDLEQIPVNPSRSLRERRSWRIRLV